jgi:hypothetical protein
VGLPEEVLDVDLGVLLARTTRRAGGMSPLLIGDVSVSRC